MFATLGGAALTIASGAACGLFERFDDFHVVEADADAAVPPHAEAATDDALESRLDDPSRWSVFDVATLDANATGFHGAAFDGRYVYFVPYLGGAPHAVVTRYDPEQPFEDRGAWATFDIATLDPKVVGFIGAAFDGRFLYFVPFFNGTYHGHVARYDTSGELTAAASWASFDVTTVDANAKGFFGAVFDGRYIYLIPNATDDATASGLVARYDTSLAFELGTSWASFDLASIRSTLKGFAGGTFDGRFVYLTGYAGGADARASVARYDTNGRFDGPDGWTSFDVRSLQEDTGPMRLSGATFDGRYLYFGPQPSGPTCAARFDSNASFTAEDSWSCVDLGLGDSLFRGVTFDGRYVYLVPYASTVSYRKTLLVARHDTSAGRFDDPRAWEKFDLAQILDPRHGFWGGVSDGRSVYFAPQFHSKVVRFRARTVAAPLPATGSFL